MQEIIVYRNPLEAAMWQMMTTGEFFVVICAVLVFFAVFVAAHHMATRVWGNWGRANRWATYGSLVLGTAAAVATAYMMWI